MNNHSHVSQCPKCQWKGLIIPKLGIGCPDHGAWWAPEPIKKTSEVSEKEKTRKAVKHENRLARRRAR